MRYVTVRRTGAGQGVVVTAPQTNCRISLTFDYQSRVVDRIPTRVASLPPSAG